MLDTKPLTIAELYRALAPELLPLDSARDAVNGERRSFALLRLIADTYAQDPIREAIVQAYQEHVARAHQTHQTQTQPRADASSGDDGVAEGAR